MTGLACLQRICDMAEGRGNNLQFIIAILKDSRTLLVIADHKKLSLYDTYKDICHCSDQQDHFPVAQPSI